MLPSPLAPPCLSLASPVPGLKQIGLERPWPALPVPSLGVSQLSPQCPNGTSSCKQAWVLAQGPCGDYSSLSPTPSEPQPKHLSQLLLSTPSLHSLAWGYHLSTSENDLDHPHHHLTPLWLEPCDNCSGTTRWEPLGCMVTHP